jgi:hypothetical protein
VKTGAAEADLLDDPIWAALATEKPSRWHNAVDGGLASYDQLSLERFQSMFDVNVKSLPPNGAGIGPE